MSLWTIGVKPGRAEPRGGAEAGRAEAGRRGAPQRPAMPGSGREGRGGRAGGGAALPAACGERAARRRGTGHRRRRARGEGRGRCVGMRESDSEHLPPGSYRAAGAGQRRPPRVPPSRPPRWEPRGRERKLGREGGRVGPAGPRAPLRAEGSAGWGQELCEKGAARHALPCPALPCPPRTPWPRVHHQLDEVLNGSELLHHKVLCLYGFTAPLGDACAHSSKG